jgi:hypothetical protein
MGKQIWERLRSFFAFECMQPQIRVAEPGRSGAPQRFLKRTRMEYFVFERDALSIAPRQISEQFTASSTAASNSDCFGSLISHIFATAREDLKEISMAFWAV